jgi:hypothetical protein
MRTFKKETITREIIDNLYCNKCGKDNKNYYLDFELYFGYNSKRDAEHHIFDLCEDCYEEIIEGFVFKPSFELDEVIE